MRQITRSHCVLGWAAISLVWLTLAGCHAERTKAKPSPRKPEPAATETPAATPSPEKEPQSEPKAPAEPITPAEPKAPAEPTTESAAQPESGPLPIASETATVRDLGSPLVDNLDKLTRLDPDFPVWLDKQNKQVVFLGEVCRADYPLEFFVTYRDRSYEAIVASDVRPGIVHTGLLALGAEPGHPARFQPEFAAPTGTEVAIEVRWKDAEGKTHSSPAQDWVRNIETKKALDANWVFAGSVFLKDDETHKERYMGDGGDFICLLNLPTAVLDLPIRSTSALESRLFEAFLEHLPPPGTPVTLLLKPKLEKMSSP